MNAIEHTANQQQPTLERHRAPNLNHERARGGNLHPWLGIMIDCRHIKIHSENLLTGRASIQAQLIKIDRVVTIPCVKQILLVQKSLE